MIGQLPQTLTVNGTVYKIRTDYRNIFRILEAFGDTELLMYGKMQVTVKRLYAEEIPDKDFEEAYKKATSNW